MVTTTIKKVETKLVDSYSISLNEVEKYVDAYLEENLLKQLGEISEVYFELEKLIQNRWVFMENKQAFYDNEVVALFPDLNYYKCSYLRNPNFDLIDKSILNFSGFTGEVMSLVERKKSFNKFDAYPFKDGSTQINYDGTNCHYRIAYMIDEDLLGGYDTDDNSLKTEPGILIPIYRLNGENSGKISDSHVISLWLKHDLFPLGLSDESKRQYLQWQKLYHLGYVELDGQLLIFETENLLADIRSGKFAGTILDVEFNRQKMISEVLENRKKLIIDHSQIKNKLLNGDKIRADIESYDEKLLYDPNRGHWDLWSEASSKDTVLVKFTEEMVARDPKADIREGGIIGIDFGTKSTVVVYQEDSEHTLPMRVGIGHFSKKTEAKHYENPTVMEFISLDRFYSKYNASKGRPETSWEDLTVSHTAFNSLMESSSEHYYSIISDLKQWAGNKKRQIRLKDKTGKDTILPSFLDLKENDMNPIELYAYFIGLYINNQHHGIYLDYSLSFPVTYEKDIRIKIIDSFEKGLKKSLPASLLEDEAEMAKFRVTSGASEPAAYAICALQEYGFDPEDNEKVFYGVFDFGGGTTDFDFGIWREANAKERRFDYVIEHFGAGGDRYLGGENILELLAFEVFKANQDALREEQISFVLPPECKRFAGSEILLSDSQEAKLNMKQLVEKLRPLWERHENYEQEFDLGIIKVNLFKKDGQFLSNFELEIDRGELEQLIVERVDKGIRNFFDSLRRSFEKDMTRDVEKINIFLAGNSSKSPIVQDLFSHYIEEETNNIRENKNIDDDFFEIFPPLGTEEAYMKQEEIELIVDRNAITKPTGKTGVAFGLVQSRKGGKIKVIDHNIVEDEAKFKYFLGMSRKGKFKVVIDREDDYGKWHLFIDASEEDFELYYTDLPEASRNQLAISQAYRKKCKVDFINDSANVYVRMVSPTKIEYVVAEEEGIEQEDYLNEITILELS
jgi:hypothetical protein